MAYPYIDTPRTDAGNATFVTNGARSVMRPNLDALNSVENSMISPSKDQDLIKSIREGRHKSTGLSMRTPRGNGPLATRRNVPAKEEFTPMLKSVTKNNAKRNFSVRRNVPPTPAFLKDGNSVIAATPGLPRADTMEGYEDTTDSGIDQATMPPQIVSSSPQSTPLAPFARDANGGLLNDGRVHSLREQENIIDRIEKENFALKMKVHFLNEALSKTGTSFTQIALKENSELKVTKLELQRDLHRYRKELAQSERDIATYRMQLEELRSNSRKKHADQDLQDEMEILRRELEDKETDFQKLQERLEAAGEEEEDEIKKLRDEVDDLQADLREKERFVDDRDDRIEQLEIEARDRLDAVEQWRDREKDLKEELQELRDQLHQAENQAHDRSSASEQWRAKENEYKEEVENLREELQRTRNQARDRSVTAEERKAQVNEMKVELDGVRGELQKIKEQAKLRTNASEEWQEKAINLEEELQAMRFELQQARDQAKDRSKASEDLKKQARELNEELDDLRHEFQRATAQAQEAKEEREEAMEEKRKAEEDLQELQDDMSNKSVNGKGLLRQLEDKASRYEDEVETLRKEHARVKENLEEKTRSEKKLRNKVEELEEEVKAEKQQRSSSLELATRDRNVARREKDELAAQLRGALNELERVQEEKDLLQTRHEGLVKESSGLQNDLTRAKSSIRDLEQSLREERKHASTNDNGLRTQHQDDVNRLSREIDTLHQQLDETERRYLAERDEWDSQRRILEKKRQRAEQELQEHLQKQANNADQDHSLSLHRHEMSAIRRKESKAAEREAELKATVKALRSQVTDLDRDLHEANAARLAASPRTSPTALKRYDDEIKHLRKQLLDAHKDMKELRRKNRDLEAELVDAPERVDLHSLLKTSSMEAETLSLKLSERETQLAEVKSQLRRVREERTNSTRKAELAARQVGELQQEQELMAQELDIHVGRDEKRHGKELRGLEKQILWLKARLSREERMRKDLIWGKRVMVVGEEMRVECNAADLSLIAQMGIKPPSASSGPNRSRRSRSSSVLSPIQKLRAAAQVVIATTRMQKFAADWAKQKRLGDGLRKAKSELAKRRKESGLA